MSNIQTSGFVKKLAANDRPTRTAALESLKKFLLSPRPLPLLELEKLWKGLFYAMWFSDRPRPQQRLANELGQLFITIPKKLYKDFSLAFWIVISREWSSIDHHRLDKFLLLLRRAIFYQLKSLKLNDWNPDLVEDFLTVLSKVPLSGDQKVPTGITYHLIDIYNDELEKVLFEDLEKENEDDEDDSTDARLEIVENAPLKKLYSQFETLSKEAKLKTIRDLIKSELLSDERLVKWKVVEIEGQNSENDSDVNEETEESEWEGFE